MFGLFNSKSNSPTGEQKLKTLGQRGEEFAQTEYVRRGYKIIASNFFNKKGLRKGEVDFIAVKDRQIIFVEVKTRNSRAKKFGGGEEAVNFYKQAKLLQAVKIFLLQNRQYAEHRPQVDVCVVTYREFDNFPFCAKIITNAVEDWN